MLAHRMIHVGAAASGPSGPPTFVAAADSSSSSETTSHSVTIPSHSNGDLLVVAFAQTSANSPAVSTSTPSGWSVIEDVEAGSISAVRLTVFTKIGNGSESSVSIDTASASGYGAVCAAYSGASGDVDVSDTAEQESGVDMTAPSVTTTVDNTTVIFAYCFDDDASTEADVDSDAGFQGTLRGYEEQGTPSNGFAMALADMEQESAGSSGTCVFSTNGDDDGGVAITLAIEAG